MEKSEHIYTAEVIHDCIIGEGSGQAKRVLNGARYVECMLIHIRCWTLCGGQILETFEYDYSWTEADAIKDALSGNGNPRDW